MAREALQDYLSAVGAEIRWRRARAPLLRELSDHIFDQAADFREAGAAADEALERSVAEMGDPEEVGRELNRLHRPQNRWGVALTVLGLAAAGLVLQQLVFRYYGNTGQDDHFRRQLVGVLLGCAALLAVWFSDYPSFLRRRRTATFVLVFLALAPILSRIVFGDRFIALGVWRIPVYTVLLTPLPYAALLSRLKERGCGSLFLCAAAVWVLPLPAFLAPSFIAYATAALSMQLVLTGAVYMGWFSGRKSRQLLLLWGAGGVVTGAFLCGMAGSPYHADRLAAFLHPDDYADSVGYLLCHLRHGISLSFQSTDTTLLLYSISQAYGRWVLWAAAGLIALFTLLLARRIHNLQSRSGKLMALSALCPLLLQAVSYLLYNLGWFPGGVLSLPFLSYGVALLIVDMLLAGALLSVFRMDALFRDGLNEYPTPTRFPGQISISVGGGTLSIAFRRKT